MKIVEQKYWEMESGPEREAAKQQYEKRIEQRELKRKQNLLRIHKVSETKDWYYNVRNNRRYHYRNANEKVVARLLAIAGTPPLDFDRHKIWRDENGTIFIGQPFGVPVPDSPPLMATVGEFLEETYKRRSVETAGDGIDKIIQQEKKR